MHAPWRIDYIKAEMEDGCVLCTAAGSADDREKMVVHRGRDAYILMNKYPYTNGHLMVAPYAHLGSVAAITPEVWTEIMTLTQLGVAALERTSAPHGFNIGMNIGRMAGAGVEGHLHMHIVPRWNGDVNFMPVLADVRVVNQHIEEAYDALIGAIAELLNETQQKGSE
jgi:ATP adenylyltransferase